ncbi:hypothetical protein C0J52_08203 [Blattella germanica]|nr:hypothetical protein C0J52_08203 [Blattella germanica]
MQSIIKLWPSGTEFEKVLLVVTDRAPYMLSAIKQLKPLFPKLKHVTYLAHALHRVCESIRNKYNIANEFISALKKILLKAPSCVVAYREITGLSLPNFPNILKYPMDSPKKNGVKIYYISDNKPTNENEVIAIPPVSLKNHLSLKLSHENTATNQTYFDDEKIHIPEQVCNIFRLLNTDNKGDTKFELCDIEKKTGASSWSSIDILCTTFFQ